MEFKRGLSNPYALEATKEFLSSEVGEIICNDQSIQLCIRDNYINIYYKGCSVLKYSPLARKNKYLIHSKYLDGGDGETYVSLDLARGEDSGKILQLLSNLDKPLNQYICGEKESLARYLLNPNQQPFLLDLEVAFVRERNQEEKARSTTNRDYIADRIDMACIVKEDNNLILRLVEVKVYTDPRLRSSINGGQEVLNQMRHYRAFLKDQKVNIQTSYRNIADNYLGLNLLNKFPHVSEAADILNSFRESGVVDLNPYLLIIGNKKNMKGKYGDHAQLLSEELIEKGYKEPIFWDEM